MSTETPTPTDAKAALPHEQDLEFLRKRFSMADLNHPIMAALFNFALERLPRSGQAGPSSKRGIEIDPDGLAALDPVNLVQMEVKLPPIPTVLGELQKVTSNPDSSAITVGEVISKDTSLTAWVLKLVNSPFFGFSVKVDTVTRAVTLLGIQQIKTLAMGGMLQNLMVRLPENLIDLDEFWRHSVATALAAESIWKLMGRDEPERLFVAGLLHDCGTLALAYTAPKSYKALALAFRQANQPMFKVEQELFTFDHARLGGMLLHRWNMPLSLVMAVLRHHQVEAPERYPEAAVVHMADIIAFAVAGRTEFDMVPPLDTSASDFLKLTPANINFIAESTITRLNDVCALFRG